MPIFNYLAKDKSGKQIKGKASAASKEKLADKLLGTGYSLISINEEKDLFALNEISRILSRISINDKVMFTVQLSNMLGAGVSLPSALNILIEQTENPKLKQIIENITEDIKKGKTFSDALRQYPAVFSTLFTNMIQAGETAGNLEEILDRLGKFIEREADLKQKLTTALMYPVVLLVMGLLVVIFVVMVLLPSFVTIYTEAQVSLPLPTRMLLLLHYFLSHYWHLLLAGIAGLIIGLRWFGKTKAGRYILDLTKLKLPIWGTLIRKATIARFSRTLSSLLSAGLPMIQSLETTKLTVDNAVISKVIEEATQQVSKGESLSAPLKLSREFPPMPVQMIAVGEETGTLDQMLGKIANYYDLETDYSIKRVTGMLEPIFLVIVGGIVGFIFAAIILPIFRMAGTLGH